MGVYRGPSPKAILPILKKYLKVNDQPYLFHNGAGKMMTSTKYGRLLFKIFGTGVSVDALRSIFITHLYGDMPNLLEMWERALQMGHSVTQAMQYIKH
jgi:integrase